MTTRKRDAYALRRATAHEAKRIARAVRRGELARDDVERSLQETGDDELAAALALLDKWGS